MRATFKNELYKIGLILNTVNKVALQKAAVRSANRAGVSLRAQSARAMRERYNLPIGGSSKGGGGTVPPGLKSSIEIEKARYKSGRGVGEVYSVLRTNDKPVSMIHFVRGQKTPAIQKGIKVKKRKKLKVAITRGNVRPLAGAFILKAKGSVQVYRRVGGTLHKQSVPSLWRLLEKPELKSKLELFGRERFEEEMKTNIPFFLSQVKKP